MAQIVCESMERQLPVAIACNHGEQFVLAGAINEDGANVLVAPQSHKTLNTSIRKNLQKDCLPPTN
ncbi:hypothetical protein DPMN_141854 [Dreissena polymorpha]|uniref:Uncharacterized protein n=1 Tax=Dreissena polymorpha TaxID=45954 RepID=A0A9D4GAJ3_DREPO|nr:hypothetical protein DPMN_141854 [Dreissena polymorpha]